MGEGATSTGVRVPFLDLGPSHEPLKASILEAIDELIDSNAFINGPQVEEFEQAWAAYCGTRYCAGGVPVPVDVSERDWELDVAAVEAAITARTRFVMPVHLYGQMVDMAALADVTE